MSEEDGMDWMFASPWSDFHGYHTASIDLGVLDVGSWRGECLWGCTA